MFSEGGGRGASKTSLSLFFQEQNGISGFLCGLGFCFVSCRRLVLAFQTNSMTDIKTQLWESEMGLVKQLSQQQGQGKQAGRRPLLTPRNSLFSVVLLEQNLPLCGSFRVRKVGVIFLSLTKSVWNVKLSILCFCCNCWLFLS